MISDEKTHALIEGLPDAFLPHVERIGQALDRLSKPVQYGEIERKTVAMPSKLKQATEWLEAHPDDRQKTGEWLQNNVSPYGEEISYRTWNRAKKG